MSDKLLNLDPNSLVSNPRATLRAWQRYEHIVYAAHARHPEPYLYTPEVLSVNTIVTRMRDAIRGCLAFSYPSQIPSDVLLRWFHEVIFKPLGSSVYIGPKGTKENPVLGMEETKDSALTFSTLDFSELAAFALLISRNRLPSGVIIKAPPFGVETLPKYPNLEILKREDGSLVLL